MLGDYVFMEINGSGLDSKFHLGWDATEGERFYYRGKSKISEEEFDTYFSDLKEPDYMWLNWVEQLTFMGKVNAVVIFVKKVLYM